MSCMFCESSDFRPRAYIGTACDSCIAILSEPLLLEGVVDGCAPAELLKLRAIEYLSWRDAYVDKCRDIVERNKTAVLGESTADRAAANELKQH